MISSLATRAELAVYVENLPGVEGKVLSHLTERGVGIDAICSYSAGDWLIVLLVPDNPLLAKQALMSSGLDCKLNPVVVANVETRMGITARLNCMLKDAGVGILYSYMSCGEKQVMTAVFKTSDDVRAVETLAPYLSQGEFAPVPRPA